MSEKNQEALKTPTLGQNFPNIKVKTTHGELDLPSHFSNKWFVLFSHPADFTPVCTTEFTSFARKEKNFEDLNTGLIGLSIDQIFSHIKWVEWIEEKLEIHIPFPVIADDQGKIANQLGMIAESKGTNTVRSVFVVDDKAKIRTILTYPQEIGRNIDEILRIVKALQTSDQHSVAMPANWPKNELIGDEVIVPPAQDEETAKQRRNQENCYDWWFCHRTL
jgi:peroxiredoxin (alkyl hydroperoxide reductase subunit C)